MKAGRSVALCEGGSRLSAERRPRRPKAGVSLPKQKRPAEAGRV
jgi:hypothetical protein